MAFEDIEQKVKITYETNADEAAEKASGLLETQDDLTDSSEKLIDVKKKETKEMGVSANAVSKNGGAMGILNMITGGYAQVVKDAMEAMELFTTVKKVDTVATNVATVSTVSNNTATQLSILTKIKDVATWTVSTVAKGAATVATNVATAAQWFWNAAVLANPLVAFVVAIIATVAAIYKLTTFLIDNSKANEDAANKTRANTKALEEQKIAMEAASKALKINNDFLSDMAKAQGKSSEEIRKMNLQHAAEEIALAHKNAVYARATFILERHTLAQLKNAGASDEVIAGQEKLAQSAYEAFKTQNENIVAANENYKSIQRNNIVERTQEETDRRKKELEAEKKHNEELLKAQKDKLEKEKAAREAARKEVYDNEQKWLEMINNAEKASLDVIDAAKKANEDRLKTDQQKAIDDENAAYEIKLENAKKFNQDTEELEIEHLNKINDINLEAQNKAYEQEKAIEQAKLDQAKVISDAKKALEEQALSGVKSLFSKNKKIQKAILLAENAKALASLTMNTVEAVGKDIAASPLTSGMPLSGIHIGMGALGAANIIKSTAEGLKQLDGGSPGAVPKTLSTPSGGSSGAAAPQVSFQASSENQIGAGVAARLNEQPPVQAFVVESEVTTAQQLAANRVTANSI